MRCRRERRSPPAPPCAGPALRGRHRLGRVGVTADLPARAPTDRGTDPSPGPGHPRPPGFRRRPVLVAVDGTPTAPAVARRGAALAKTENRPLLIVTVKPSRSGSTGVETIPIDGGHLPADQASRLVVAAYRARGNPRRQARRVAAAILAVARAHHAAVIVTGLPDQPHPRTPSVSDRVAHGAPAGTRVLFTAAPTAPPTPATGRHPSSRLTAAALPDPLPPLPPPPVTTMLTPAGRRELTRQYRRLRSHVLPQIRHVLRASATLSPTQRQQLATAYQTAIERRRYLAHVLVHATRTERLPADPTTVEIGDLVTVDTGGPTTTWLVVDPAEAAYLQHAWVHPDAVPAQTSPIDSPIKVLPADTGLGAALLGQRVGDEATLPACDGSAMRVLGCRRLRPTDLTTPSPRSRQRQPHSEPLPQQRGPAERRGRVVAP